MSSLLKVFFLLFIINLQGSLSRPYASNYQYPNGIRSPCIDIRRCSTLLNILQSRPLSPADVEFLEGSICEFPARYPMVRCLHRPQSRSVTQRMFGGQNTHLTEFPWMVLLEYQNRNRMETKCAGSLINKRYVLTAAHCVMSKLGKIYTELINVRLGEHNTKTAIDCDDESETAKICAPPPVTVKIEKKIPHENYDPVVEVNDIALLRLSREVDFTEFIKPIDLHDTKELPENFMVAGWGQTKKNGKLSPIAQKLNIPLADRITCEKIYRDVGKALASSQICAGGEEGKDSCGGDSGGPLMAQDKTQEWKLVGIVSFGAGECGSKGYPAIYTRVSSFTDWIRINMRP